MGPKFNQMGGGVYKRMHFFEIYFIGMVQVWPSADDLAGDQDDISGGQPLFLILLRGIRGRGVHPTQNIQVRSISIN